MKINGRAAFFEWVSAGRYACQNERGTMAMATQARWRNCSSASTWSGSLIRVDCDHPARDALADCDLFRVGFVEPAGAEIRLHRPGRPDQSVGLSWGARRSPCSPVEAAVEQIAAAGRAVRRVGHSGGRAGAVLRGLPHGGRSRDRAPRQGAVALTRLLRDFELMMWDV